jgi:hypothetical protein
LPDVGAKVPLKIRPIGNALLNDFGAVLQRLPGMSVDAAMQRHSDAGYANDDYCRHRLVQPMLCTGVRTVAKGTPRTRQITAVSSSVAIHAALGGIPLQE